MDSKYSFLVGDAMHTSLDILEGSLCLRLWFESVGSKVERFGGKSGKVIKFTNASFEKNIKLMNSVELFSERLWPKGEQDEPLNCAFSAVLSNETGLLLTADSRYLELDGMLEFVLSHDVFRSKFEYFYLYQESQVYGTAYGLGYYSPDEHHPLLWSRRSEAGKWAKAKRMSIDHLYLRDIFDFNCIGTGKMNAFPEARRSRLELVMGKYGEVKVRDNLLCWVVRGEAQEAARDELTHHELLASYVVD